ncbi:MAG: hypothetical protein QNI84_12995 [Henriciella sp.]|nr:hypothetical protein [Henriciella sp.]
MFKTAKLVIATGTIACLPLAASAQAIGSIVNMSGETGSVLVERGGSVFSLSAGDPIFAGDVISTRPGGTAQVTAFGSTVTIPSCSSSTVFNSISDPVAIDSGGCGAAAVTAGVTNALGGALVGTGGAAGGNTALLAGAATTGVVGAVASSSGGSDSTSSGGESSP